MIATRKITCAECEEPAYFGVVLVSGTVPLCEGCLRKALRRLDTLRFKYARGMRDEEDERLEAMFAEGRKRQAEAGV